MHARTLLTSAGLLLSTPALAGPGLPIGHDDTIYYEDLVAEQTPRRVDVVITDQGLQPARIDAKSMEKLELVVTRRTDRICRSDLLVPELGLRVPLSRDEPTPVTLLAPSHGTFRLVCPVEDQLGSISDLGRP